VNTQRVLVGIVTQPDVRAHDGAQKLTAADIAARPVITVRPEETLQTAVRRMSRRGLRQLAVVTMGEEGPEPVGVLRRSDALAAYVETLVSGGGDQPERPQLSRHAPHGSHDSSCGDTPPTAPTEVNTPPTAPAPASQPTTRQG
jgi:hypothetical protein